jgi:hypothetical protein
MQLYIVTSVLTAIPPVMRENAIICDQDLNVITPIGHLNQNTEKS